MRTVPIHDAEISLATLLSVVEAGEEVMLTRHGRIVARLVPGHARSASNPPDSRWGDSRMRLEARAMVHTGLLAPLD